jgi:predicted Zn-ribbon and HTH transcriptional regulator
MMVICQKCGTRFEAKQQLQLGHPPLCVKCRSTVINETTRFDDRPGDREVKERELRECN